MGLPYSRQINTAMGQVNTAMGQVEPLVATAINVLRTSRNISYVLVVMQVFAIGLLVSILGVLVAILVSVNPDLEDERTKFVTPAVNFFADFAARAVTWYISTLYAGLAVLAVTYISWWYYVSDIDILAPFAAYVHRQISTLEHNSPPANSDT